MTDVTVLTLSISKPEYRLNLVAQFSAHTSKVCIASALYCLRWLYHVYHAKEIRRTFDEPETEASEELVLPSHGFLSSRAPFPRVQQLLCIRTCLVTCIVSFCHIQCNLGLFD